MIVVQYPPALTRNFKGYTTQVPCYFSELYIEEVDEETDVLEVIRDSSFYALQENKYPAIFHFMIQQIDDELATIHFQIPACSIEQDSMDPDYSPVSYYGTIRFAQIDGSVSDLIN